MIENESKKKELSWVAGVVAIRQTALTCIDTIFDIFSHHKGSRYRQPGKKKA
jgi:hypothetical protein